MSRSRIMEQDQEYEKEQEQKLLQEGLKGSRNRSTSKRG